MTDEYQRLLEAINAEYGYDFNGYAKTSIQRRIDHFMAKNSINSIANLEEELLRDGIFFEQFVQSLSVTVTEMFRDPSFYKRLREIVMPRLATYPFNKIWVAGCATGQEAYSLSILLREEGIDQRSIVYATDINQESLRIAMDGVYGLENMQSYTDNYHKSGGREMFSQYYIAKHNSVILDKSLRQDIVFSAHNLVTDQSFNEFQLIICRNVIMYFDQQLQNKVVNLFNESLCSLGFLALGDKESLLFNAYKDRFEEVDRREKIYRKKP